MKRFYIVFILVIPLFLFSQKENDNWYFGNKAAVNFSASAAVGLSNSEMEASEACGTISDSSGKLLFYMNGQTVWNREHQIMSNGTLAPSNNNSAQQLAIVKNPADSNQYYVFITGENAFGQFAINYSIVDMTLGGIGADGAPLGDVVKDKKNISVLNPSGNELFSEAVTVVAHSNKEDFWVLIPNGSDIYAYKIDSNGFSNGQPIVSNLSLPLNLGSGRYYSIKASPKINNPIYSNLVGISFWGDFNAGNVPDTYFFNQVYSFNASTGLITNDFFLHVKGLKAYLPEFNRDASVLFLGYGHIYAVDLVNSTSSNVQYMKIFHDPSSITSSSATGIQRNIYGDVYISRQSKSYLGKVINPDVYTSFMSVDMNAVSLLKASASYGLPQIVPIHDKSGFEGYYPCVGNLTLFSEPNMSFYYKIAETITTKDKYILQGKHNITMQAGESINLLPGTFIDNDASYYGFIAPCSKEEDKLSRSAYRKPSPVKMFLELDKKERVETNSDIKVYPNPVSDFLTITAAAKINNVEVYDISGKRIEVSLKDNKVDVRNLSGGVYLIIIETKNGKMTKQFIKK
ncbi:T9SS type A sorting domain-containing protein [Chryseobacterium sp. ES2]|uniref:T9SS type A sorting domain-containing protein n=1 Tax=Chryseobacterium metallicongregator TaxID=3073042 RepID=A0ABU1E885_9FLAO|nr:MULTISPECIES: T9SS type A sorting domain-containing protein [Chryseobacterium]MDR4954019.1 T9SS type A sorting domain-containing protein [Chryseobacterium sp. ES2]